VDSVSNGVRAPGFSLSTMNRSSANKIMSIHRWCFFPFFGLAIAVSSDAQNRAQPQSPLKFEGNSTPSQAELDDISVRNALAAPLGEKALPSSPAKSRVGTEINPVASSPINNQILEAIKNMPAGGDYRATSESIQQLESAIKKDGDHLDVNSAIAKPSFCSSATYLVFVSTLQELNREGKIQFEPGVTEKLLVTGQRDGVGVWGRWNSNGPGTARLFAEFHLGPNFTSIEQAQAGDFLKIFWNDQIGFKEFGHSVVYLGHGLNSEGIEVVRYWSSNKKGGYGRAEVPRSKIKKMLFSRLAYPEQINQIRDGLNPDEYLASMLVRSSSSEEMKEMVGIPASPGAEAASTPHVDQETKVNAKHPSVKNSYQTTP
jgi:hypothetical protein